MGEITIDAAVFNGLLEKIHTLENAVMCDKMCDKKSKPTLAGLVKVKPLVKAFDPPKRYVETDG